MQFGLFLIVSAFSLSNVKDLSLVHIVVDSDLLSLDATELIAFHPATSEKTTFMSATELKIYLDSLGKEYKVLNLKELAAAAPVAAAKAPATKAPSKPAKAAAAAGKVYFFN
jgi:prolyl-tRNA synthetase